MHVTTKERKSIPKLGRTKTIQTAVNGPHLQIKPYSVQLGSTVLIPLQV